MPSEKTRKSRTRKMLIFAAILLLPALIRILVTYAHFHHPLFSSLRIDEEEYNKWAMMVKEGYFFRPFVPIHSPGYPWLLGIAYGIFGYYLIIPRIIQIGLGLGSMILVQRISDKLIGKAASYISALMFGLYWPLIIFEQRILDVNFFVFLNLLGLFLAVKSSGDLPEKRMRSLFMWVATGVCFGAAVLVRPPALAWLLGVLVWLIVRSILQRSRSLLIYAVGFAISASIIIAPMIIKNHAISGRWFMMQANTRLNFYYGNNPQADGTCYARLGQAWDHLESMPIKEKGIVNPYDQESYYFGKVIEFMKKDPVSFAWLQVKKLGLLLNNKEIRATIDPEFHRRLLPVTAFPWPGFMLVLAIALPGLLLIRPSRSDHQLLLIFLATHALVTSGVLISSRYRMPFTAGLIILSGAGAMILAHTFIRSFLPSYSGKFGRSIPHISPNIPRLIPWVLFLAGLAIAALPIAPTHTDAEELTYVGYAWRMAGDDEKALKYFNEALKEEPGHANALVQIARIQRKRGQIDDAFETLKKAEVSEPDSSIVHYDLGIALWQAGRKEEAVGQMKLATDCRPMWITGWKALAVFEYETGSVDKAREHVQFILTLDPNEREAHELLLKMSSGR